MARPNLRLRREVRALYRAGNIFRGRWMHVRLSGSEISQTLIAVRRKFGGAVRRNLARRRVRSICRELNPGGHPGRLLLISLSDRSDGVGYDELRVDLQAAFTKFGLLDS